MKGLYDYAGLIKKFLNREISAQEFETTFFEKYLKEEAEINDDLFEILDWLFAEVESFTDTPLAPDQNPEHFIDERRLRESAEKSLIELEDFNKE